MAQLETITNNLRNGYKRLEPDSFQPSHELLNARRTNSRFAQWFYTANLELSRIKNSIVQYGIGGRESFSAIAGVNIDDFCDQLNSNGNYKLTSEQEKLLEENLDICWVNASDLKLQKHSDEYSFFEIYHKNYAKLNDSQRAFAEAIYGTGEDFVHNMKMLEEFGISITRIYVLNENYIKENAKNNAIARACWLLACNKGSKFVPSNHSVSEKGWLRGKLRAE